MNFLPAYHHYEFLNPNYAGQIEKHRNPNDDGQIEKQNSSANVFGPPPPRALNRFRDWFLQTAVKLTPSQYSLFQKRFDDYFADIHIPDHPPYAAMIERAISEINEDGGSNEESISNFIRKEYPDLPKAHGLMLKRWLCKLCETGDIVLSGCNRYSLCDSNSTSTHSPSPSRNYNPSSSGNSSPSPKTKQRKMKRKRPSRKFRQIDDVNQPLNPNSANQSGNGNITISSRKKNLNDTSRHQSPHALPNFKDLLLKTAEKVMPSQKSCLEKCFDDYFVDYHIPDHPSYAAMIQGALRKINEEGGSSEESISNLIKKEYPDLPKNHMIMLKKWLGKLSQMGEIVVAGHNRYLLGYSNSPDTPPPSSSLNFHHVNSSSPSGSSSSSPSSNYTPSSSPSGSSTSGSSSPSPIRIKKRKMKGNDDVEQEKTLGFEHVNLTSGLEDQSHSGPQQTGGQGTGGGCVVSERQARGRPRKSMLSVDAEYVRRGSLARKAKKM